MDVDFSLSQLDKLSDLCLSLSKGLLLAALALPALSSAIELVASIYGIIAGLTFLYFSLKIEEIKGEK